MTEKKKDKKEKTETSWSDIGQAIGKKIEKESKNWKSRSFVWEEHKEKGGSAGRLLFILGVIFLLKNTSGLPSLPWWNWVLIIVGFMMMSF